MIRKIVRQMLAAQILSALTVSLCMLIDNIMIGRFLGEHALTAYGLANPVLLVMGAVGSMLSTGAQVECSKSLGRGDREETDIAYSTTIAAGGLFSLGFMLLVLFLQAPIARMLGAKDAMLLSDTRSYIAGFILGAPASVGALVLVPFLQIAGQSTLLIVAVLGMTIADVAFDLMNVFVFHGGMFGMGLASALSYYVAVLIGIVYFLSKKCVFSFSLKRIQRKKIRELIKNGAPLLFGMVSSVVMVYAVNHILLGASGEAAVAAFSVTSTIMNASNSINIGIGGVALTLSSVLYNEEDRNGLSEMVCVLARYCLVLGIAATALLMTAARPCVALFIPHAGESQAMAILGLRCYSTGITFCCLNSILKSGYQGTDRVELNEAVSVLDNAILPILSAFLLSRLVGLNATWFLYVLSETLTLCLMLGVALRKKGRHGLHPEDVLLLKDGFGVPPEDFLEVNPSSLEDVVTASRRAEAFCRAGGGSSRLASHLALCIEEMGSNIVSHGFTAGKENHVSIRLLHKGGAWTLRFRDDCMEFDPIRHVSEGIENDSVGIRLAMRMADEARYTYSMNLNNLMLILKEP
ncbi:MAG: ATP-binding protein, partial [Clostridia bacterium]|nr:ATP-binding protein [Clostridia bacterium]